MGTSRFDHVAWFYDGPDDLARRVDATVASATAHGDGVLVCVDPPTWGHLVGRLGALADSVTYVPADVRYARPAGALATLVDHTRRLLDGGAGAVWSIGEIDFGAADDVASWIRYEAAANETLVHLPIHAVCLYDVRRSSPAILEAAHRTHPRFDDGHGPCDSAGYLHPRAVHAALSDGDPTPAAPPALVLRGVEQPVVAREAVGRLLGHDVDDDGLAAVALAVTELVANALEHAGTPADVSVWRVDGAVVLQVSDGGAGFDDPFPELRPPGTGPRGRGLWIVGQLADRVHVAAGRTGTAVSCVIPAG